MSDVLPSELQKQLGKLIEEKLAEGMRAALFGVDVGRPGGDRTVVSSRIPLPPVVPGHDPDAPRPTRYYGIGTVVEFKWNAPVVPDDPNVVDSTARVIEDA